MNTYPGVYRGIVTADNDPESLLRVKVRVPQVLGNAETNWAWPVVPNLVGVETPKVGDPVWVAFEAGDVENPVWLGTWKPVRELISGGMSESFLLAGGTNEFPAVTAPVLASQIGGEAQARFIATSRGFLWGNGTIAPSKELYWDGVELRANVGLRLDGRLVVGAGASVTGNISATGGISDEGGELAHEALFWMEV